MSELTQAIGDAKYRRHYRNGRPSGSSGEVGGREGVEPGTLRQGRRPDRGDFRLCCGPNSRRPDCPRPE
ncbi:MAG: hypothetical protein NTU88_16365, partial [Armatimonadetes bacterium]|nr:hypothetical protein [Armatimonadota bacterium]